MKRNRIIPLIAVVVAVAAVGSALAAGSSATAVKLGGTKLGKVLVNSKGFTLYLFEADKHGKSACYGQCATYWPPLLTTARPIAGTGVKASLLGTLKRKDGKLQVTYAGHPLYGFKFDKQPRQTTGEAMKFFGGEWYVVSAAGLKIEKHESAEASSTSTAPAATTPGYGSGGYSYP
jgi:predicted lipoprotein with Yx(FWY)xxD motif